MIEKLLLQIDKYPLDFITQLSGSFPILIGLQYYKRLPATSKFIIAFFAVYFIQDSIALYLSLLKQNNLFIQNLESISQLLIVGLIYYYSFDKPSARKLLLTYALVCLLIEFIYYKSYEVSSIDLIVVRIFSITLVFAYFNKIVLDLRIKNVVYHTLFWFSAGLLMYSAGTFFIVLFSQYWYQDINKVPAEVFDKYWNASQVLFILFSLLSSVGLWFSKYDSQNTV